MGGEGKGKKKGSVGCQEGKSGLVSCLHRSLPFCTGPLTRGCSPACRKALAEILSEHRHGELLHCWSWFYFSRGGFLFHLLFITKFRLKYFPTLPGPQTELVCIFCYSYLTLDGDTCWLFLCNGQGLTTDHIPGGDWSTRMGRKTNKCVFWCSLGGSDATADPPQGSPRRTLHPCHHHLLSLVTHLSPAPYSYSCFPSLDIWRISAFFSYISCHSAAHLGWFLLWQENSRPAVSS